METFICPHCGKPLEVHPAVDDGMINRNGMLDAAPGPAMSLLQQVAGVRQPTWQGTRRAMRSPGALGIAAGAVATDEWQEARYETPMRQPTPQGDVIVPLAQAAISGAIAGVGALVVLGSVAITWHWPAVAVIAPSLAAGLGTMAVQWFDLLRDSRALLRKIETFTRHDLDGDGAIGAVPAAPEQLAVTITENRPGAPEDGRLYQGGRMLFYNLPVTAAQLAAIAAGVDDGKLRWSVTAIAGQSGISETGAKALIAAMLEAELLRYRDGQKHNPRGYELTARGRAVVRRAQEAQNDAG